MSIQHPDYQQTIEYLYERLPMFQRVGAGAFKKDLTNIRALLDALGQPQHHWPCIHVAGTNGKGTVSHLLSSIFQAAGYKTGLYTSPHYRDFRERIKINGRLIEEGQVVKFVAEHKELIETIKPSFFEITVALAFVAFAEAGVEMAIIETGLGGRLDSTNVVEPVLSVITNISYDHQEFLGDTLPEIAKEKAGIIKSQVPVVIGKTQEETRGVFAEKAAQLSAPIVFADRLYRAERLHWDDSFTYFNIYDATTGEICFENLVLNAHGPFQAENLVTVLAALDVLNPLYPALAAQWKTAFLEVKQLSNYIGRWQLLQKNPRVITDSAHNEGGLRLVMEELRQLPHEKLHLVLGVVKDKSPDKILKLLPAYARYYFAKASIPRAMDSEILREKAAEFGLTGTAYPDVKSAMDAAITEADPNEDLVFVGGSTFVVADIQDLIFSEKE